MQENIRAVASEFDFGGTIAAVRAHGQGLINDTYEVLIDSARPTRAILQRINRRVFPHPEVIMRNMVTLLEHAAAREGGASSGLRFPALYRTRTGEPWFVDETGDGWRAMTFIEHTRVLQRLTHRAQATEVGRAMGRFHALVRDLDPRLLRDGRPDYHDTPRHLDRLDRAVSRAEARAIDAEIRSWLVFVDERREGVDVIEKALRAGRIPRRPVHGDTKLNNFLFDETEDRVVSLIDLDTVRPGIVHHDIADCLRSCCNRAGESPDRAQPVRYDLALGQAILSGYFETGEVRAGDIEVSHLYEAIRLIPFELGMRFLADHLEGDRYFKIDYPGQNLWRAATQFRLTADVERQRSAIEDAISGLTARLPTR
jgi:Ser/Thr protein kinase RdoA (MazF antagonist)